MNIDFFQPIFLIKIVTLIAIAFYAIFGFVVLTQMKVMTEIVHIPHTQKILRTVCLINIALAISLFLFAVVIL